MTRLALVLLAVGLGWPVSAIPVSATAPAPAAPLVCRPGVVHVALLSRIELCPRPLAMAKIDKPPRHTLRT